MYDIPLTDQVLRTCNSTFYMFTLTFTEYLKSEYLHVKDRSSLKPRENPGSLKNVYGISRSQDKYGKISNKLLASFISLQIQFVGTILL